MREPSGRTEASSRLAELECDLARWRRIHHAPTPLPNDFWSRAADLGSQLGVSAVARSLRLNAAHLKRRTSELVAPEPAAATFIELLPPMSTSVVACRAGRPGLRFSVGRCSRSLSSMVYAWLRPAPQSVRISSTVCGKPVAPGRRSRSINRNAAASEGEPSVGAQPHRGQEPRNYVYTFFDRNGHKIGGEITADDYAPVTFELKFDDRYAPPTAPASASQNFGAVWVPPPPSTPPTQTWRADANGQLIQEVLPDGTEVNLTYDDNGAITSRTEVKPNGETSSDVRDSASWQASDRINDLHQLLRRDVTPAGGPTTTWR